LVVTLAVVLLTMSGSQASASENLSLCEALTRYFAVNDSFQNGWNASQDLALSPRLLPLLRAIRAEGPKALRGFWNVGVQRYVQGVLMLRNAGFDDAQLQAIAQWDISTGDNAATTMIEAGHPTAVTMANVYVAFDRWQHVVDHFEEPQLHGKKLAALRSEVRDCGISRP
jgi:hypothetical protein